MKLKTRFSTTTACRRPAASEKSGNPAAFGLRPSNFEFRTAFSLVEIIVVVALLSMIILGLLAMFGQTQRAFRGSMTQVDVLEGGRAASGLLAREMEQMTPSGVNQAVNFYAEIPPSPYAPLLQPLPGIQPPPGNPVVSRTNLIEDLFFLVRQNQTWTGIGYHVDNPNPGFGTLYRFETNSFSGQDPAQLFTSFIASRLASPPTTMSRVMDGVVHFKVRTFYTSVNINGVVNGLWLTANIGANIIATNYPAWGEVGLYAFSGNAVPASVELEIGILEQRTLERVRAIPNAAAQLQNLQDQAGRVHLFRQRVTVHNVDPAAYQ